MQTKWHSFLEALQNISVGMGVALVSQLLIFPFYGINIPLNHNVQIMMWFTGISILRSYLIRRWNNRKTMALMVKLEEEGQEASKEMYGPDEHEGYTYMKPFQPTSVDVPDEHELINERPG